MYIHCIYVMLELNVLLYTTLEINVLLYVMLEINVLLLLGLVKKVSRPRPLPFSAAASFYLLQ